MKAVKIYKELNGNRNKKLEGSIVDMNGQNKKITNLKMELLFKTKGKMFKQQQQ